MTPFKLHKMADSDRFINELYKEYFFQICSYCTAMLNGDETAALDCTHEVFDAARKYSQKLQTHPNPVGWLKVTAANRVKRELRKRGIRLRREQSISDITERYLDSLQSPIEFDEYDSISQDALNALKNDVLSILTPEERTLYTLRFENRLTYKDISLKLNIPTSTVRMRLLKIELRLKARALDITDNSPDA